MELLKLHQVSYRYEGAEKAVLNHVSCSFEAGKLYCVKGSSGAGKSTLLSLMAGLDVPASGEVLYEGAGIAEMNRDDYRARKIGVIFQNYNLLQNAAAAENVMLAVNISGKKMSVTEVYDLLSQVGIDQEKARRKVLKLSGGEQQRVAIARAIAGGAPILAADEPTGNLDTDHEAAIMEIFERLAHETGKCVIVVTHSPKAAAYADETLLLQKGSLIVEK